MHRHAKAPSRSREEIAVLAHERTRRGLTAQRQMTLPVVYDGFRLEEGFRADLIVME